MNITDQIPDRMPDDSREAVSHYWRNRFEDEPYCSDGEVFEDYEPAYLAGHQARIRDFNRAYEQVEVELHRDWDSQRGAHSLAWSKARHAVRRAWENAGRLTDSTGQH